VYIVDTASENDLPYQVPARTVIFAPPNSRYYKYFLRCTDGSGAPPARVFIRQWSLPELLVAREYINAALAIETVVMRWSRLGGTPRHVFSDFDGTFEQRVYESVSRVRRLSLVDLSDLVQRPDEIVLDDGYSDSPNSGVVAYVKSSRPFRRPVVGLLSAHMLSHIWKFQRENIVKAISRLPSPQAATDSERSGGGAILESVAVAILREGLGRRGVPPIARLRGKTCGVYLYRGLFRAWAVTTLPR
jgi:hypothetical protein